MIAMKKIQLLPAREQVASVLREAILKRELKEGEELTLEGTAEQLGVSSMPVREAFQILATDGLIKLRPNKGAIVLGVNEKTIRDHYETRERILPISYMHMILQRKLWTKTTSVSTAEEMRLFICPSGQRQIMKR